MPFLVGQSYHLRITKTQGSSAELWRKLLSAPNDAQRGSKSGSSAVQQVAAAVLFKKGLSSIQKIEEKGQKRNCPLGPLF